MRLVEMDAKRLLQTLGVQIPRGFFIPFDETMWPPAVSWSGPCFLKAQVLTGRRGQQGLVRRCATLAGVSTHLQELKRLCTPQTCEGFLCEEEILHDEEWFVSCDIDRIDGGLRAHVSRDGGEGVSAVRSFTQDQVFAQACEGMPTEIISLMKTLIGAMSREDALCIEINPCVLTSDGRVIALDAKIVLDDAAMFRHPEWKMLSSRSRFGNVASSREQAYLDLLTRLDRPLLGRYIELSGTIGTILFGGGASLVAMDALKRAGGEAANYLEMSGNPDPSLLRQAAKIVFSHPHLRALWIAGSFANATDVQQTIGAILIAYEESGLRIPIVIRRDGPEADAAEREALVWAERRGEQLIFQRGEVGLSASAATIVSLLSV